MTAPAQEDLRHEGRDTPELRAALATSADLMETHTPPAYRALRRPCVLRDADERCTVYDQRPRECGAAFVFSPAELCSERQGHSSGRQGHSTTPGGFARRCCALTRPTRRATRICADYLAQQLAEVGYRPELIEPAPGRANLIVRHRGTARSRRSC